MPGLIADIALFGVVGEIGGFAPPRAIFDFLTKAIRSSVFGRRLNGVGGAGTPKRVSSGCFAPLKIIYDDLALPLPQF
jgi:hypothetical protein